jgi:hypothetical protein
MDIERMTSHTESPRGFWGRQERHVLRVLAPADLHVTVEFKNAGVHAHAQRSQHALRTGR